MRAQAGRRTTARLAGIAIGIGGLALMGFGTIGSPLTSGARAAIVSGTQTIVSISEDCSLGKTTGTLNVTDAVTGNTVKLEIFAHNPGDGLWHATGATTTITMVSGTSNYSYTISGVPAAFSDGTVSGDSGSDAADPDAAGDDFNSWRVQVSSVTGAFDGTTTKSDSFDCSAPGTTTTSSTGSTSTTHSTSSSTTSSSTTSSSTTSKSTSSSSSSSSSTSSTTTGTAPGTTPSTSSTSAASTGTPGTGVQGVTTPGTGAGSDAEFGIGLALLLAGSGLVAAAARGGRRPKG